MVIIVDFYWMDYKIKLGFTVHKVHCYPVGGYFISIITRFYAVNLNSLL